MVVAVVRADDVFTRQTIIIYYYVGVLYTFAVL